ncbi:MAG: Raf kinase inhibitor-like YbhB/YbcL family protein [Pseudohongiellaceae bacterium]
MQLSSESFANHGSIPPEFAFAEADTASGEHVRLAGNRNPQLSWSGLPSGTLSLALLCVDPDAPTVGDDVNREGRTVAADLPRGDFYHWVMVDIPPSCSELAAGVCSDGVTAGGKLSPPGPSGARQGQNDFTSWFSGDADMGGTYNGYDGPAPPWNDERLHHYRFQLFALDIESLMLAETFTAIESREAMVGHIVGSAEIVGSYTQNPALLS